MAQRQQIGARYSELLEGRGVVVPYVAKDRTSVYVQYSIRVSDRERLIGKLGEKGIPTAIHYPMPLHLQEAFKGMGHKEGDFPVSKKVSKEIMSLPMSAFLIREQQDLVVKAIRE